MNRRNLLAAALALPLLPARPAFAQMAKPPMRTRWNVTGSEGFDAIAFLGALSGRDLYRARYAAEADAFGPKLPAEVRADIPRLADEADKSTFGLLWPVLANILSGAGVTTLASVIALLSDLEGKVRPAFVKNPSREDADFDWLKANASRLVRVFTALRDAGFAAFRRDKLGAGFDDRIAEVTRALAGYDVVHWQEKLTGRTFDPVINVVLLAFSKPHGAKMQGQTFLQAADYDTATTVRIAAHEMLHPPFPMDGPAARAALAVLAKDPLIPRIVREHDPKWGYTTLDGMLNEDMCEALDQLISEALGVARNPADRWRRADDGIHVLAAALYGLLRQDKWVETGGDIEQWTATAAAAGRLAPESLHAAASRVLERPADRLWPLA
ncbi:hypothetical protein [Sphingomonas sp. MS122]|uniref:hypothetical protein n=1 Tax=Sphingomonas sp. MS122 TaxID=3412683 RepID=UPI003C30E10A